MKVSVLGAGAIGSMLGGLLQHDAPDLDVMLIVRGEHGRVIGERGTLLLDGPWGTREVPIHSSFDPCAVAGSQFVFVTVKSQATEEAARAAAPHWAGATVVSIQNGINDQRLAPLVEPGRLVMGMTATNMATVEPGRVSLQLGGATILGDPAPGAIGRRRVPAAGHCGGDAADAATAVLNRIRCPTLKFLEHPNALGVRYNKLAVNALGYASCLSASNFITEALADRSWRETVGLPIVRECRRVFDQAGIRLQRIPGVPSLPRLERFMRWMSAPVAGPAITLGARRLFNRKPIVFSLQQDLERRKPTEVDFINGEIERLAESVGMAAPANAEVVRLVRELERRGDGTFFEREEVVRSFGHLNSRPLT
jgi:2-dehydropantoate 2-reductase